jgi:hypothetical protein
MKDFWRRIRVIWSLARRGAWIGVRRFSVVMLYGLTHRRCKRCRTVKGLNVHSLCYPCQYQNFVTALNEMDED